MGKKFVCYCYNCRKETKHKYIQKDTGVAERLFLGLCTVGLSEVFVRKIGECCRCGEINEE